MSDDEIAAAIQAVEVGEIAAELRPVGEWPDDTHVVFRMGTAEIAVFADCGEWDYIDRYRQVGETWIEASADAHHGVFWYRPNPAVAHRWPWPSEVAGFAGSV